MSATTNQHGFPGESITEKVANLQLGVHDFFQQRLD
jgi:hypothetical protein